MNETRENIRRHRSEVKPWAEVHHLEITEAKLHYHEHTGEIYYVLSGSGAMQLDAHYAGSAGN